MVTPAAKAGMKNDMVGVFIQVTTLLLSLVAIVWGVALDYTMAFPGPSGEWASIGTFLAGIVDIPVGIISAIVAATVRNGSSRLRRLCIVATILLFLLPLIGEVIHRARV